MKTFLKILLASLLFLPATALATTAVPWSITNLTDGFIFPNLVNGSAKGILVSASSTFNGNLSVSTLTNGDCVQAGVGGILVSASSACGSGGSTPGGLNLQVQYNNAGAFGGISGAVTNGTILNLTNPLLGGATLTTSVVNGVTLTSAGSATSYLNGTGAYSVPVGTTYTGTFPIQVIGTVISSLFSTTTTFGLGNNSFLVTGPTGIPFVAASSTLNLPTSALASQNISQFTNNSGYLTANQTITLTGAVTGSGATAITTAFGAAGANTVLSNGTGATAVPTFIATSSLFQNASASASGLLTSTDWSTFNGKQVAGNYITALTGDITATGPNSVAATLATVNTNVGTFTYPSVTVNGKGLVTAISNGTAPTTYTGAAPITVTGSIIGTSFSTSTFNAFTAENTFTNLFATNASSTNATSTNLAITGAASNCNGTSALTTNSSGVVGCTAQPQGTVTAVTVATANGFAGSSSGGATPTLTLSTTITGLLKGNGTAISAAALTDFPSQAANTVIANGTGVSAVPTAVGTSTLFGTPTPGTILAFLNGQNTFVATTTFSSGVTYLNGNVTNTGVTSNVAGTGISVSGATGAVTISNTGVTSIVAGTGISISGGTGAVTVTNSSPGTYPFTPSTFGINVSATTTPILDYAGLITATSTIGALTASSSIVNQSVKSALVVNSATGLEQAYTGGTTCSNQFYNSVTANGNFNCASLTLAGFPSISANTVIGNSTGVSGIPTAVATSSLFTGTVGQNAYFASTGGLIGTSSLFIATNSNIGIGTTTQPSNYQTEIASVNNQQLVLSDASIVDPQWAFRNAGGTLYIGTSSPTNYSTSTSQSAIQVSSSAATLFGIATSTPWRTLSVTGTVSFAGLTAAVGTVEGLCLVTATNEVVANSLASCVTSSRRWKTDIDYSGVDGISTLMKFQSVTFTRKDSGLKQVGFIAEDVAAIDPRLAGFDAQGIPSSIDEVGILSIAVKAIQQQQAEITSITKGTEKDAQDNWQWVAIALLAAWNVTLTLKKKRK